MAKGLRCHINKFLLSSIRLEPRALRIALFCSLVPFWNQTLAEVMLKFRNFWNDYQSGLTRVGDVNWKEIDEAYLVPNPYLSDFTVMSPVTYVTTVLGEANQSLQNTNFQMVSIQNELSERPETNDFLAQHFTLDMPGIAETNRALINNTTKKMELVFRKVKK